MDMKELKKALAGLCVASLASGAGLLFTGCSGSEVGTASDAGNTAPPAKEAGSSG